MLYNSLVTTCTSIRRVAWTIKKKRFPVVKNNKKFVIKFAPKYWKDAVFSPTSEYDKQKEDLGCFKNTKDPYIYPLSWTSVTNFHYKAVTKYLKEKFSSQNIHEKNIQFKKTSVVVTVEVKLKRQNSEEEISHNRKTLISFRDLYVYTLLYH
jgi:hypothetical protein